jgi:phosphoribosylamine---glycine ligase
VDVLIVGGGGREHTLAWKLAQSPEIHKIYCAPGNAGIAALAECVPIDATDVSALQQFARDRGIHLTVVGPEAPLMEGIVDLFQENGQLIFGPSRSGALLEGSKVWAKQFMSRHQVPTAEFEVFETPEEAYAYLRKTSFPTVVKADGLAAGKGVIIAENFEEAARAVQQIMEEKVFGAAGDHIVIEEFLQGEEVSVFAITDGLSYVTLPSAQDHKAIYDGDRGPNTGGMGAYSPAPILSKKYQDDVERFILEPVFQGLAAEGIPYRGVLFVGLIITERGAKVLEFNVRFGDPEAQVILPRMKSDLLPLLYEGARGNFRVIEPPEWHANYSVCVVMASAGYPGAYEKGKVITGLAEAAGLDQAVVFHAGTALKENQVVTAGGRVLGLTAWDHSLEAAVQKAYKLSGLIHFEGAYYRRDIARRALKNP